MIAPREALQRLHGIDLDALAHARLDAACEPVARGTGASAGVATGRVAFDSASATRLASSGEPVILMRPDISTADVAGFATAAGIVTAVGAHGPCRVGSPADGQALRGGMRQACRGPLGSPGAARRHIHRRRRMDFHRWQ